MISLHLSGEGPLNHQVYAALRLAILSARIGQGTRLAPSRVLAAELGVSRNTVLYAYEQLIAEGYAHTRSGSGTFVSLDVQAVNVPEKSAPRGDVSRPRLSALAQRLTQKVPAQLLYRQGRQRLRYDFLYGEPAYADFPIDTWARIVGKKARGLTERQLGYAPVTGTQALKEAVAGYLTRSRGVICDAAQVVIVQGTQEAIDLTVRLLVDPGDTAVLEEPAYRGFAKSLRATDARIVYADVDEEGLCVDQLSKVTEAKLAFVTPSHQFPAGGVLPLSRRLALLAWAAKHNTILLEDDYDGEFRYEGKPITSLQSLDTQGRVIYVGTASKICFPSLRIGWVVVPDGLMDAFAGIKGN